MSEELIEAPATPAADFEMVHSGGVRFSEPVTPPAEPVIPEVKAEPVEVKKEEISAPPVESKGHISRDDWIKLGRDPEDWRSERQFKDRGELIGTIKTLQHSVKELTEMQFKMRHEGYKQAVAELTKKQTEAAQIGDSDSVSRITDQLVELRTNAPIAPSAPAQTLLSPELLESLRRDNEVEAHKFMARNTWFKPNSSDPVEVGLAIRAKQEQDRILTEQPELKFKPHVYLQMVEDVMRPVVNRYVAPPKPVVADVAKSDEIPVKKKAASFTDLTKYQQSMYSGLKKANPSITLEGFIDNLKKFGDM